MRTRSGSRAADVGFALLAPVILLTAWEAASRTGAVSAVFFPPPSRVAGSLVSMAADGRLWPHVGMTVRRVLEGFAIGGAAGLAAGIAMGRSRRLRVIIEPLVALLHAVPKIALLPLAMLLLGLGEASKVALVAVAVFFPMAINTEAGIRLLNPVHLEVARNYGASGIRLYRRVIIPGSLPMILTGVRLALNIGLLIVVAIELVAGQVGLGRLIWFSWQTLRTEELYAALVVTALLGASIHHVVRWLEHRFLPWLPSPNDPVTVLVPD
jgi:NitT/TauT family transport system permease protein